ncbi:MAG: STAS domain-containing protein [Terracidiphilus sp.]
MTCRTRSVIVKQVPETLSASQERSFWLDLDACMNAVRPCLVLDCSRFSQIDKRAVHLLLRCLEEALKRNGDVRLAGATPEVKAMLESIGANRLFRTFDSNADAIRSFHRVSLNVELR